jgi:hypothetical protein
MEELLPLDGALLPLDGALLPLDGELLPLDGELLPLDGALVQPAGARKLPARSFGPVRSPDPFARFPAIAIAADGTCVKSLIMDTASTAEFREHSSLRKRIAPAQLALGQSTVGTEQDKSAEQRLAVQQPR